MRSAIEVYSAMAKTFPVWSAEEEREFIATCVKDGKWISSAAKDRFVNEAMKHNLSIVFSSIKQYAFNKNDDDIVQIAVAAMVEALKKYDPNKEIKISTWITNPIKWAILQAQNKYSRAGTIADEVAAKTRNHKTRLSVVSLDADVGKNNEDGVDTLSAMISVKSVAPDYAVNLKTHDEMLVEADIKRGVSELLSTMDSFLTKKETVVIRGILRGRTLADIGVEMNLSRMRISQISHEAFKKIKNSPLGNRLHALVKAS